ncbi:uncharacterized protein LOC129780176 isoform X2 [Toxorhynchites rutilus septentrionalis]|uniref:uncharacterized protein LOC129780176 isoform X2 n=1 Tax=Toxorhynchites rutilus septentrionalis TaxID=329112 RepID=UPI00247A9A3A|nr:uncharacterized protein LOC129780176 isoform X2 [Toxorhynchites rutilus septentrionalis]
MDGSVTTCYRIKMYRTQLKLFTLMCLILTLNLKLTTAQSNYASHGNSIEYQGEGLPEEATLDGKVTKLDDLSPIIFLNRTKAALNCAAGSMLVELKFNERFFGMAYANFDRSSACQITGKGDTSYSIELPLKGCGTKQEPQRVFTNNIVVRFHPGLEMDGDEIITIVCRYPPPVAPIPAGLPAPILTGIIAPPFLEPPLKGIQILFIICAIMFLTLLLIGLGLSYYCLRRQPIPIVRRVVHVGSGSEITALETGSIDDVFMQTVTEKTTIEDIERHKRMVTEYKAKPADVPNWDVTIRNYRENSDSEWENFSDISSASGITIPQNVPAAPASTYIFENDVLLQSPELVGNLKPIDLPPEDKSISNWDVLIRVLQDVEIPDIAIATSSLHTDVPPTTQLSYDDKTKWKEIITTESTLRTMLTEAVYREDFERIRSDARYEKLFVPQSWEIIMRILSPPDTTETKQAKRKKRETWDTRSRRSSLPTLYEYDSDGGSSVRTITQDPIVITAQNRDSYGSSRPRSRKTSRSSYSSNNIDYRSMTEVTVDFAKQKYSDNYSDDSSYHYDDDDQYYQRSIQPSSSHPSLARSTSEFLERWIAPDDNDSSTPEASPQLNRRENNLMMSGNNCHQIHEHQTKVVETRQTNYSMTTDRDTMW